MLNNKDKQFRKNIKEFFHSLELIENQAKQCEEHSDCLPMCAFFLKQFSKDIYTKSLFLKDYLN